MLRVDTAPEQLKARPHQSLSWSDWQKGLKGCTLGQFLAKTCSRQEWEDSKGEKCQSPQSSRTRTAQIPVLEGRRAGGREGARHLQGEPALQSHKTPARIPLYSALHKQAKAASSVTGLSMQKMALLLFPLNFKAGPEPLVLRRPLASSPAPSQDGRRSIARYRAPGRGGRGRRGNTKGEGDVTHTLHWAGSVSSQTHIDTDYRFDTVSSRAQPVTCLSSLRASLLLHFPRVERGHSLLLTTGGQFSH